MKILVDADACPNLIKKIIFRAANREQIDVLLVANQPLNIPPSSYIKSLTVGQGFDVADDKIVSIAEAGDLIITADIPLADQVIKKACLALNPRGELYTKDTIQQRVATRNLMQQLRDSGTITGGPSSISQRDVQAFANQLDTFITRHKMSR